MDSQSVPSFLSLDAIATRACLKEVIMGYLLSENIEVSNTKSIGEFVETITIAAPVRKTGVRRKRSPEEIEEAERMKQEKKEARAAKRLAEKEAKAKAKAEKKAEREAKKTEAAAKKAADKAEWMTPRRLQNPNGGDDPRGHNGHYVRYQFHRTSGEMRLINANNWTDETKELLEVVLAADKTKKAAKASKPDMMKAVKAVAKKQAKPKMSMAEKKAQLMKKAADAKKAKAKAKAEAEAKAKAEAEAEAKAKAEAEAKAKAEAEAAATLTSHGESKSPLVDEYDMESGGDFEELEAEEFGDIDDERTPFKWDKNPNMELWEDSDKWVWDGPGEDANPICYYDEDECKYVSAPGNEDD